jgi:hypothetical protein
MKKTAVALSILLAISSGENVFAEPNTREQVVHYQVELENVKWYQKIAMFFLGLNWDEFSIKTTFAKNEDGTEKVISVIAWPDDIETENPDESDIVFDLNASSDTVSFLKFVKHTEFRAEETPKLLPLFNYLYDEDLEEKKISTTNLFEKENGSMHCKFAKQKDESGKSQISIRTLNSSGAENGWVEVTMNPSPEKHLEKIHARLKIGIKIILTRIEPEKEDGSDD